MLVLLYYYITYDYNILGCELLCGICCLGVLLVFIFYIYYIIYYCSIYE